MNPYEQLKFYEDLSKESPNPKPKLLHHITGLKKKIRKQNRETPNERVYYSNDGESCRSYFESATENPEEIASLLKMEIHSDYSPTGLTFTHYIVYAKKPNGNYLFCHCIGVDV